MPLVEAWMTTQPYTGQWTQYKRRELRFLTSLDSAAVHAWIMRPGQKGRPPANNSIRQRMSIVRNFCDWLVTERHLDRSPIGGMADHVRKQYPRIYGKRQHQNPARFLTYDEAFGQLLGACKDGTWRGSRDQIAIRLGLLGLRRQEIVNANWSHYHQGAIVLTGKGNRIREVRPGPTLTDMLRRWRRQYERQLGRPVDPSDPIVCGIARGRSGEVRWGVRLERDGLNHLVKLRAQRAGLGHVSAHDLRRTAASIMHYTTTPDGGHIFDLLDIQKALDHADTATTQRSYLDHLDTKVKTRAGTTLD
jgi:integrase